MSLYNLPERVAKSEFLVLVLVSAIVIIFATSNKSAHGLDFAIFTFLYFYLAFFVNRILFKLVKGKRYPELVSQLLLLITWLFILYRFDF